MTKPTDPEAGRFYCVANVALFCAGYRPYTRKSNGKAMRLVDWRGVCLKCGGEMVFSLSENFPWDLREPMVCSADHMGVTVKNAPVWGVAELKNEMRRRVGTSEKERPKTPETDL